MSYSQIMPFYDGKATYGPKFQNSHGSAPYVWSSVCKRYNLGHWLLDPETHDKMFQRDYAHLYEEVTVVSTCDTVLIRHANFKRAAECFRKFVEAYSPGFVEKEYVDHLGRENKANFRHMCHYLSYADFLDECDAEAIGFWGTSIVENPWTEYEEETGLRRPYGLDGDKHFFLFDHLNHIDS